MDQWSALFTRVSNCVGECLQIEERELEPGGLN